ncbi:MAG: FimB/Mfa2 family fimbrial subunit [Rikenellaceae bacterium]|nr:FimB/Mfa2 family fimbrial subunit [Rikenellaceae bacterium]
MLLLPLLLSSGCIRERYVDCQSFISFRVNVIDRVSGDDVTHTGVAGEVKLFMFDASGMFIDTLMVSPDNVAGRTLISIPLGPRRPAWVSAWGNISPGQLEATTPYDTQTNMDDCALSLCTLPDGYSAETGEVFFGMTPIDYNGARYGYVGGGQATICQHYAPVSVIVNGLPSTVDPNDYYFEFETPFGGYNFRGLAAEDKRTLRQGGMFDAQGRFITSSPVNMVPRDASQPEVTIDNCMVVSLYRRAGSPYFTRAGGDVLVASTRGVQTLDPQLGVTVNVLITLGYQVTVSVVVTPMDEIWQDSVW